MTEKELEEAVMALAAKLGWRRAHFHRARSGKTWITPQTGEPGFPDLVLVRDRVLVVELKSAAGAFKPGQEDWLAAFAAAGVESFVWRPADLGDGTIDRVLSARTPGTIFAQG